ncbi:hypothetical protein J2777_005876 [Paraburkholderia graminis]|uniref:hypothetical protein n=1 Tax=Paraburkholderia graminis TaxID=60548 RepID=UPI0028633568|nr:hypothetical protein [Paraburkholderia graminis]MDR6472135.1 hypothetical protein [Paraburkholderia graminis]
MSAAFEYAPAFVPSDIGHAKRKAKQLRRAFPRLTLSSAQQVTSEAVGFDDWHALERAVRNGIRASALDSEITASEVAEGGQRQAIVLARRLNLSQENARTYLLDWGLTRESRPVVADSVNWPAPPIDEHVSALVCRTATADESDVLAVAGRRFARRSECRVAIVDRHLTTTEVRRRFEANHARTKKRAMHPFPPQPLAPVFSSLVELDAALTRWDASGAEFFVAFSGAGTLDDGQVTVHRANSLFDKVLPWLLAPFKKHNGEISPHFGVDSALERLLQARVDALLRGFPEQPIFRSSVWIAESSVDPKRVQIMSRRLFEYDEAVVGYQHNRWRRHMWRSSEDREAVKQAMLAMDTRVRAATCGDGALCLQYLMPDNDCFELVLPKGSYKVLPPGFFDSARHFIRENAVGLSEFS